MKSLRISLGLFVLFLITFSNRSFANKIINDSNKILKESMKNTKINEINENRPHEGKIRNFKIDQNKIDIQEHKLGKNDNIKKNDETKSSSKI